MKPIRVSRELEPERCAGLDPVTVASPEVLILGSFPSRQSLARSEYYGNPRNHFWQIIEAVYGIDRHLPYADRVQELVLHRVALWDVIRSCHREGSADDRIRAPVLNDIHGFLAQHPTVRLIAFNGTAAERCYTRYCTGNPSTHISLPVPTRLLPSTSPANTRHSFEAKCRSWAEVLPPGEHGNTGDSCSHPEPGVNVPACQRSRDRDAQQ